MKFQAFSFGSIRIDGVYVLRLDDKEPIRFARVRGELCQGWLAYDNAQALDDGHCLACQQPRARTMDCFSPLLLAADSCNVDGHVRVGRLSCRGCCPESTWKN